MRQATIAILLLLPTMAPGQVQMEIDGINNAVLIDNYNTVDAGVDPSTPVTLVQSSMMYDSTDPASRVDQVAFFMKTANSPCGYYFVVTLGKPVTVPCTETARFFLPEGDDTSNNSGTATIQIGSRTIAVDAVTNAIRIGTNNSAYIDVPPSREAMLSHISSTVVLRFNEPSLYVAKAFIIDTGSTTTTGWLYATCVGDANIVLPAVNDGRRLYGFIADQVVVGDNRGTSVLQIDLSAPVTSTGTSWGDLKAAFRN